MTVKRVGTPAPLGWWEHCKVCGEYTRNQTLACTKCEGLVVGERKGANRIRFKEIARPENEWEVVIKS